MAIGPGGQHECIGGCEGKHDKSVKDTFADLSQEKQKRGTAFLVSLGGYGPSRSPREIVFAGSKDVVEKFAAEKYSEHEGSKTWFPRVDALPFVLIGEKCPFCSSCSLPFDLSEPIGP